MKEELEKLIRSCIDDPHDKTIDQALTSIINLVDKEIIDYQKLFIDAVEIGLKGVGLSLNEKEWLDLVAVLRESEKAALAKLKGVNNG